MGADWVFPGAYEVNLPFSPFVQKCPWCGLWHDDGAFLEVDGGNGRAYVCMDCADEYLAGDESKYLGWRERRDLAGGDDAKVDVVALITRSELEAIDGAAAGLGISRNELILRACANELLAVC